MILGPTECLWHLDHYGGSLNRVLDIGAYHGVFSIGAARRGAGEVHALEPDGESFTAMKNAIVEAGFSSLIRTMNVAVTRNGRPVDLYGEGNTSSLVFEDAGKSRRVPSIAFRRLLQIMAPVDYLKVDIEGAEFEIFDYSDELAVALMGVGFMEVEIHKLTDDETLEAKRRDSLIEWLQDVGFDGEPCGVREIHAGAFCSFNRYFMAENEHTIPFQVAAVR